MKKLLLVILSIILLYEYAVSQENKKFSIFPASIKSSFDIRQNRTNSLLKSASGNDSKKMHTTMQWEFTLMSNGYFTIGTNMGNSALSVDDKCEITFGHPYSMTSFAYPILDEKALFPHMISSNTESAVQSSGDTLSYEVLYNDQIQMRISMFINLNQQLVISYNVLNADDISHNIGMGLLFDAALGKWGDGRVIINEEFVNEVTKINASIPDSILIWERESNPLGIGIQFNYSENKPDEFTIGNWYNEFSGENEVNQIYDLAVHSKWYEAELLPGNSTGFAITLSMQEPDQGEQPFLRWDMPYSLSIENQQLFPSKLSTTAEIINSGVSNNGLLLKVIETDYVYGWETKETFSLNETSKVLQQPVTIQIPEMYDSLVVPITLQLEKSGTKIDEIIKHIFIPAAPFSDEGLHVVIDTAYIQYGQVFLSFHCAKEETGQLLYQLHRNNIFLYDNEVEVQDFTLAKDTSGGTNKADIIFVLDVTGSMTNEIAGVRDNIIEFCDSLSYRGIDFRLGMVTFLDEIENIYDFTDDVQQFQLSVSAQYAHGGGDGPENSLDALSAAAQFEFRQNANRIIIWITDANFHINNTITQLTKEAVIDQLLAEGITVHCIGDPVFQTDYYDQIILNTGGDFYNINENFRDILLEVSRLNQSTNHLLSFYHPDEIVAGDIFNVEIHYAGLGGADSVSFGTDFKSVDGADNTKILFYPNPFAEDPKLLIEGSDDNSYRVELYNIQGQLLNVINLDVHMETIHIGLSDLIGSYLSGTNNVFLLKTIIFSPQGEIIRYDTRKIKKL